MEKLDCSRINEDFATALRSWQRSPTNPEAVRVIGGYLRTANAFGLGLSFRVRSKDGIYQYNFRQAKENASYRIMPDEGLLKIKDLKSDKFIRSFDPAKIISLGFS